MQRNKEQKVKKSLFLKKPCVKKEKTAEKEMKNELEKNNIRHSKSWPKQLVLHVTE